MTVVEVPLSATPQTFPISLGGTAYQLTLIWRATEPTQFPASTDAQTAGSWVLDIADTLGNAILRGIPLVTGADLLAQYAYLAFPGSLVVQTDNDPDAVPTYDNLGSISHLYFVTQ